MKRKLHTPEQIVKNLREADAIITQGGTVEQACKQLQISDATYYKWRKQYGQMKLDLSTRKIRSSLSVKDLRELATCD